MGKLDNCFPMFSFVSERKTCQVFPVHTSKFSKVEVCDTGMRDSDICYTGMRDCTGHSIHGSDTRVLATEMLDTVVRYTILILMSAGADADIPDKSGVTPLHLDVELGNSQICIHLLEEGKAQVNACDQYGATPLQCTSYQGHKNIANILFSHSGFSGDCVAKQNRMSFVKHDIASSKRELQPLAHVHRDISGITSRNGEHFDTEKEEFAKLGILRMWSLLKAKRVKNCF